MRRVVVTGIGMNNALGLDTRESFKRIINGETGVGYTTIYDTSKHITKISAEVKDFDPLTITNPKDLKKMDRFILLGKHAARSAMRDSGIVDSQDKLIDSIDANSFGVSAGAGIGGLPHIEQNSNILTAKGSKRVSPFFVPSSLINMTGGIVAIDFGLKGPNLASATACSAGVHAITESYKTIVLGFAEKMLAVGAESAICPVGVSGFASMKALSSRNDDPARASRPFDKERDGFVMGEGAGALVLEEYEAAKKRGAKIYAEIIGLGESGDAYHITTPAEGGEGAKRAMLQALKMANKKIDYVNAHGTSTKYNDLYETMALKDVFGSDVPPVSSTKGQIGHCLGAAGAIEAIISILSMHENVLPPTINQEVADEELGLDYIPNVARDAKPKVIMSNSFGFGGTNGSIIFEKI